MYELPSHQWRKFFGATGGYVGEFEHKEHSNVFRPAFRHGEEGNYEFRNFITEEISCVKTTDLGSEIT
jgi:hypothetical protein